MIDLLGQPVQNPRVPPVAQGIGWAAWPREDIVRLAQAGEKSLRLQRRGVFPVPEGGGADLAADVLPEVGDRPGDELIGIRLEAKWGVKEDGVESRMAGSRHQLFVDRRHGRTDLSGAKNRHQARRTSVLAVHTRNATQIVCSGARP